MAASVHCGPCGWSVTVEVPIDEVGVILDAEWAVHQSTPEHEAALALYQAGDPEARARVRRMVSRDLLGLEGGPITGYRTEE